MMSFKFEVDSGKQTSTVVPCPGLESIVNEPSNNDARSRMPAIPSPANFCEGSKPMPLSRTRKQIAL